MCHAAPDPAAPSGDELTRLTALHGSGLLEEGPRAALDALVDLAAGVLGCPTAMLTLVDRDMVWVSASNAGTIGPVPRDLALCSRAIDHPEGLVVADLARDDGFPDHPLADEGTRFYAGVPVHAIDVAGVSRPIGALCVVDGTPRRFDATALATLRRLGAMADMLIAVRADAQRAAAIAAEHERLAGALARQHHAVARAERMARLGSWRLSLIDERVEWSAGAYAVHGLTRGTPPDLQALLDGYRPAARARLAAALADAIEHGTPFDVEEDFQPPSGGLRRVRCIGEYERDGNGTVALVGVVQDVGASPATVPRRDPDATTRRGDQRPRGGRTRTA